MGQPFYYSWMRQHDAVDFNVDTTEHDEFVLRDGRRVYDMISTSFQANFGHQHPLITARIVEQLNAMPMASPKSTFPLKTRVSQRLLELINLGADDRRGKMFYTVSGSEAVENALKIARQQTGRTIVLARQKSYHGATLGALSVTGDWRNDPHQTYDAGTVRIPEAADDPDLSQTKSIVHGVGAQNIAAIILETISGTNGMSIPTQEWWTGIESLCRENEILLIVDEVLVGFGRCGPSFAFQDYGISPDLVCLSKAISGGYVPFGAVWTSSLIADRYDDQVLACGLTNYAHPLGLAAAEAVLDVLADPDFQTNKQMLETVFAQAMGQLRAIDGVAEVRCRGLMAAIEMDRAAVGWQAAFDAGLHLYGKQKMNILAPPYVSTPARLRQALNTYCDLIESVNHG